ncbi:cytochrome P450 family protein [Streptomonospora alba]|uniref:cytochrome P450 family protein n=1 Tax=Streptomonospora alba TaxID=183763 RepID=UPI00069AC6FD|nr:cytochrome P450 [Streptomonospora alba]
MWAITHYDALKEALRNEPEAFVRNMTNWRALAEGELNRANPMVAMLDGMDSMLQSNDPDHARVRRLVQKTFTHRRIQHLRPQVEAVVDQLLDGVEAAGRERTVDLKSEFAVPLPIRVISDLLSIPEEDSATIQDLTTRALSGLHPGVMEEFWAFIDDTIERKRARPDEGLISALIAVRDEDEARLSPKELRDNILLFYVAGYETTMGVLTSGVQALLEHPDQLELIRTGQVAWSQAIEEILRWQPSAATLPMMFTARDGVRIGDVVLDKGEPLLLAYLAANRDPAVWEHADTFDITREAGAHLAFGHGPHHCLGAPLARMELGIALPAVFERLPDLHLWGERPGPAPSLLMHHPASLRVILARHVGRGASMVAA